MRKIHEKIVSFFESKILVGILYGIGIVIVLSLIFAAGVSVGFHKASFSHNWGENYERNFGMMGSNAMMQGRYAPWENNFPNAHGAVGKIIKIELPTIIVQDKDKIEKVVLTTESTQVRKMRQELMVKDLKTEDFIVVIGSPNINGEIEAKLIRVMPAPELLRNEQIKNEKQSQ